MAVVCYSGGAQLLKWRSTIGKELPRHRISTAISAACSSKPKTTQLTSSSLESFEYIAPRHLTQVRMYSVIMRIDDPHCGCTLVHVGGAPSIVVRPTLNIECKTLQGSVPIFCLWSVQGPVVWRTITSPDPFWYFANSSPFLPLFQVHIAQGSQIINVRRIKRWQTNCVLIQIHYTSCFPLKTRASNIFQS